MVEYTSLQMVHVAVALIFCFVGVTGYTVGRFLWKQGSIKNINEFLQTLDIGIIVEQIKFDSKFLKTMFVAVAISIGVVVLCYGEIIAQIDFTEPLLIVALKFTALGLLANFGTNTLAKGGTLSSIIQALLAAFAKGDTIEEKQAKAQTLLAARNLKAVKVNNNFEHTIGTLKTPLELSEENRKIQYQKDEKQKNEWKTLGLDPENMGTGMSDKEPPTDHK